MRVFQDYMFELQKRFPWIAPREQESYTWRAIANLCNELELSFMLATGRIITEPVYNTGTISVTSGGTAVALSGGTWDPTWLNRRITIQGRTEEYGIDPTDATDGVLDMPFLGTTNGAATYRMFRRTYSVPADCEFGRELLIWDPLNRWHINLVDFLSFQRRRHSVLNLDGRPYVATRAPLDVSGNPQLTFGPQPPSAQVVYELDYYVKPTKPTAITQPLSPAWPDAFNDVIPLRAATDFSSDKKLATRVEIRQDYNRRKNEMLRHFDGAAEMTRRVEGTNVAGSQRVDDMFRGARYIP